MKRNLKRIYVVEGPSGAGKTTFVSRLEAVTGASSIYPSWIQRPRSYDEGEGEVLAVCKDLASFGLAVVTPGDCILDRYAFSSFVYSGIRIGEAEASEPRLKIILEESSRMLGSMIFSLEARGIEVGPKQYNVIYLFLLPSMDEIKRRRENNAGRDYPYPLPQEYFFYQWLADIFTEIPIFDGNESDETIRRRLDVATVS